MQLRRHGLPHRAPISTAAVQFRRIPLNASVRANYPGLVKIFLDHTPLGRAGKPGDIVGPAVFLASADASYITGEEINVDGGLGQI